MRESVDLSETRLQTEDKAAVVTFCQALQDAPNLSIVSVALYGSAARKDYRPDTSDVNLLVVVERLDVPILKTVLEPVARSRRYGVVPFFITETNLRSSADVFPVKFLTMQESYKLLIGSDVLGELQINHEHLRLRCEQEIKNLLLRLSRYYIMENGRGLTQMMARTVGGFLETLRVAVFLAQKNLPSREEVVNVAAKMFECDAEGLRDVSDLRKRVTPLPHREAEQLYDKFMAVVHMIAQAVDQMD